MLPKIVNLRERPSISDIIFDFISQSFGQTRNRTYAYPYAKILLITAFFLCYIIWAVNSATLFNILATVKMQRFEDYAELNASDRIIYIANTTRLRYGDVDTIDRF